MECIVKRIYISKLIQLWNLVLLILKLSISILQKSCSNLIFLLHIFWLLSGLQTLVWNPTFFRNRVFEKIEIFFFTQGSCNDCLIGFFSQTAALKQLIGLYIGRCHACWKQPEVVQWLERNVKEVMKRVDRKDSFVEECSKK